MTVAIRSERRGDGTEIARLITAAFETAPHRSGTEAQIVDRLRDTGSLTVSLVATLDGAFVGHVAMSPVNLANPDAVWFGLGPVAVLPSSQGKGIGEALVRAALERIKAGGADGCVVLGDPAYYGRFGFRADPRMTLADVPAEFFQVLPFGEEVPVGDVTYDPAFAEG